jgi:hypothetical protein
LLVVPKRPILHASPKFFTLQSPSRTKNENDFDSLI